jgi:hypothetical protein
MQGTEQSARPKAEQVARARPPVERWLTWSGLVPLPVFLALHLSTELYRSFAADVSELERDAPGTFQLVTLVLLVWVPLAVHGGLGLWRLLLGERERGDRPRDPDVARLPRVLSRVFSIIALAFLLQHTRELIAPVWLGASDPRDLGFRLVASLSSTRWALPLSASAYLLGLAATLAHAGLAAHRGLLGEGLLTTSKRRTRSAQLCATLAALLFGVGAFAVIRVASGSILH